MFGNRERKSEVTCSAKSAPRDHQNILLHRELYKLDIIDCRGGREQEEGSSRSDELETELVELVELAYSMLAEAPDLIKNQDTDRAVELLSEGRNGGKRCDRLLIELAHTELTPAQTTSMVLLTRFHKRLGSHTMNILSSIVMPMHKVDFWDLKELEGRDPV